MSAAINTPREALEAILARLVAHAALKDSLPLPTAAVVAECMTMAEQGLAPRAHTHLDPHYVREALGMLPKYRALLQVLHAGAPQPEHVEEIARIERILAAAPPEPRGLRDARGGVS